MNSDNFELDQYEANKRKLINVAGWFLNGLVVVGVMTIAIIVDNMPL